MNPKPETRNTLKPLTKPPPFDLQQAFRLAMFHVKACSNPKGGHKLCFCESVVGAFTQKTEYIVLAQASFLTFGKANPGPFRLTFFLGGRGVQNHKPTIYYPCSWFAKSVRPKLAISLVPSDRPKEQVELAKVAISRRRSKENPDNPKVGKSAWPLKAPLSLQKPAPSLDWRAGNDGTRFCEIYNGCSSPRESRFGPSHSPRESKET